MITVKLRETPRSFGAKVNKSIAGFMNSLIQSKSSVIKSEIQSRVPIWIKKQPEMIDLASGKTVGSLAAQLGLYYGSGPQAVEAIANAAMNSIVSEFKKISAKDLSGGLTINFVPATFDSLLNLPEGHVVYEEGDLHWLKWLLLDGTTTIIVGYHFSFLNSGRSLGGVMRKGGAWRIPPQYAGIAENNFITRALTDPSSVKEVENIIKRHFS